MRTIEEVRKHLSEIVYNNVEDRAFIAGFLKGEGLYENWDKPLDFAEYEENDLTDFFAWWDKANEEDEEGDEEKSDLESMVEAAMKNLESKGFKVDCIKIEQDEEVESAFEKVYNECQKKRQAALNDIDKNIKELQTRVESISDPKLKQLAMLFLGLAKELKEKAKKKMNA